jgi:hypothetical protein
MPERARSIRWHSLPETLEEDEDAEGLQRRKALLYPDVPWGDGPFPGCQNSSRILCVLDWSLLFACLYVGGSVPYLVGFGHASPVHDQCVFSGYNKSGGLEREIMSMLDVLSDVVFCADIFAQFHTAVWELVPGTAQVCTYNTHP